MPSFYHLAGVRGDDFQSSHRFVTSWLLPPLLLAILRGLIALYVFTTIFFIFGWQGTHGQSLQSSSDFSYFTSLTFWGIAFYFLFAAAHTAVYAFRGYAWLDHWPRPLQALHSLFYTTIVTFPPLVTIVFWVILYKSPWFTVRFKAWSNVSQHGLNTLFAVLEIILPATNPPPWLHLAFLIFILALYVALAYLTHATKGFYTYNFLDPATGSGRVAGYCFGILAAIIVIFAVVWLLIWTRRKFTRPGKGSRADVSRNRADDFEMLQAPK